MTPTAAAVPRPKWGDRAFIALLVLLATGTSLAFVRAILLAGVHVPLDYDEGWNAYHAADAMAGRPLYPLPPSMVFNNYPPFSFYAIGAVGRLLGDQILAGRIVSLVSVFASAACIAVWLLREGVARLDAAFAALFFPAVLLAFTRYVGMNDPQLLGHALGMSGIVLLVRKDRARWAVIIAALLMTLAIFTKQILIVQPAAGLLWLARKNRRDALAFALSGIAFAVAGLAVADFSLQTNLLGQMFSPRVFALSLVLIGFGKMVAVGLLPMIAAVVLYRAKPTDPAVFFAVTYLATAVGAGVFFSGGTGVDSNATFDAVIAASLCIGLALKESRANRTLHDGFAAACLLPLVVAIGVQMKPSWVDPSYWLTPLSAERVTSRADIKALARTGNPAFCETLALCYWAGLAPQVDVFSLSQAVVAGRRDERDLVRLLDARGFRDVQLTATGWQTFSNNVRRALVRNYKIDHADAEGVFLTPR